MGTTAMDNIAAAQANRTTTENGCPSLRTAGDPRVDAFFKLVRGLSHESLEQHVDQILSHAQSHNDPEICVDAFVLWASTRDVRGGKGERQLAHWLLISLARRFPQTVVALLPLIPEYGSWRDVFALLSLTDLPSAIGDALVEMAVNQLQKDSQEGCERPSLCGKWAPRPKSALKEVAKQLAAALYPQEKHPLPVYRKMLSAVNKRLGTVEVAMAGHDWASIKPGAVPARCLKVHRAAFMNLTPSKKPRSESMDRQQCATNFTEHALLAASDPSKARMHGRVLHPHEMVKEYMRRASEDDVILEAQWTDLRERLREEMPNLGKMVPLCDVSGSMSGTPMEVAIALGVLISEVGAIRDRFITFSSNPQWHVMQPDWSLRQKVQSAMGAHWEMSTDFQKALEMVLEACAQGEVPPEEVGELSLVVLSDMQFDAARSNQYGRQRQGSAWDTQYERLVKSFEKAGLESKWKQPYPVPRVIFWNLRGDTRDFPASATTPGVECVSGFSPNLLKLFMEGGLEEMMASVRVASEHSVKVVNPYETLRKALDDPRYQRVREVCAQVGEGQMAGYVPPVLEQAVDDSDGFVMVTA